MNLINIEILYDALLKNSFDSSSIEDKTIFKCSIELHENQKFSAKFESIYKMNKF